MEQMSLMTMTHGYDGKSWKILFSIIIKWEMRELKIDTMKKGTETGRKELFLPASTEYFLFGLNPLKM